MSGRLVGLTLLSNAGLTAFVLLALWHPAVAWWVFAAVGWLGWSGWVVVRWLERQNAALRLELHAWQSQRRRAVEGTALDSLMGLEPEQSGGENGPWRGWMRW